jgi:DNA gyrase subunit A
MITREGISVRFRVGDLRTLSRNTQGVRLINLADKDSVVGVARLAEKDDDDNTPEGDEEAEAPASDGAETE